MPADTDVPRLYVNVDDNSNVKGFASWQKTDIDTGEFLAALKRDVTKTTYEDFSAHSESGNIRIALLPESDLGLHYEFDVWDTFEETCALLRAHNPDIGNNY